MIIITEIKSVITDRDRYQLKVDLHIGNNHLMNAKNAEEYALTVENINGRDFINPQTNERFTIGLSNKVAIAFGMPFEVIENQQSMIIDLRCKLEAIDITVNNLKCDLNKIRNYNFIEIIKFWFRNR